MVVFTLRILWGSQEQELDYEVRFQSPQNFEQEVKSAFGNQSQPHLFANCNGKRRVIGFGRLHNMLQAQENGDEVFEGYQMTQNYLQLMVEFGQEQDEHKNDGIPKHQLNKSSDLCKLHVPRVSSTQMAKQVGLPIGYFITSNASKNLSTKQKLYWEEKISTIVKIVKNRHGILQYLSNCNTKIKKVQKQNLDWEHNEDTKYLFVAAQKWIEQHKNEFEQLQEVDFEYLVETSQKETQASLKMEKEANSQVAIPRNNLLSIEDQEVLKGMNQGGNGKFKKERVIVKRKILDEDSDTQDHEEDDDVLRSEKENKYYIDEILKRKAKKNRKYDDFIVNNC
eukprot:TRINITY_DN1947_c0_g2_i2.p1 TRINITY_DN1947_c0_g2~~TRINITY_DN1947_c0_g2_i2.p1  ORF type:complete len:338 (-),score=39.93 TRINITY_DN1947_c0_g2_i2:176-1189(-)